MLDYLNKTQVSRSFGAKPPCQVLVYKLQVGGQVLHKLQVGGQVLHNHMVSWPSASASSGERAQVLNMVNVSEHVQVGCKRKNRRT